MSKKELSKAELKKLNAQYITELRQMAKLIEEKDKYRFEAMNLKQSLDRHEKHRDIEDTKDLHEMNSALMGCISVMWHLIDPHDPHYHPLDMDWRTPQDVKEFIGIVKKRWQDNVDYVINDVVWNEQWRINYDKEQKRKDKKKGGGIDGKE